MSPQVTSQDGHAENGASSNYTYLMLKNFSDESLTVHKAIVLCVAERIVESIVE